MKTSTTNLFIQLIINPLSATPSSPSSRIIILPINPQPEELIEDGIFLQINDDDVFLQEFANSGVDNAGAFRDKYDYFK